MIGVARADAAQPPQGVVLGVAVGAGPEAAGVVADLAEAVDDLGAGKDQDQGIVAVEIEVAVGLVGQGQQGRRRPGGWR